MPGDMETSRLPTSRHLGGFALILIIGIALRIALLGLSPYHAYTEDHDDFVRWGHLGADQGLAAMYAEKAPRWQQVRYQADGSTGLRQRGVRRTLNYPPLSAYAFWACGHVHKQLSRERYVNTHLSRAIYAALGFFSDLLIALGCLRIAGILTGSPARSPTGMLIFALAWLAPPLAIDSAFWGQNDSWMIAASVWMLSAMLTRRWIMAGLLYGVALGCKPLAIFYLPIWGYAVLFGPQRLRIGVSLVASLILLNLLALPFWLTSGSAWFQHAFASHFGRSADLTTASAFNIWYVDALLRESRDAGAVLLGLPRYLWGHLLLLAGAVAVLLSHRRMLRDHVTELPAVAASSLLAITMLPTGIHERYILMCLPFVVGLSATSRRLRTALIVLLVACTLQLTWCNWAGTLAGKEMDNLVKRYEGQSNVGDRDAPVHGQAKEKNIAALNARRAKDRPIEWATVLLALGGTLLYFRGVLTIRQPDVPPGPRGGRL